MAQSILRNLQGTAVSFQTSQVINIRATTEGGLLQSFRSIEVGAANEFKPLVLVQTNLRSYKQIATIKAIVISPTYWASLQAAATPATLKQINTYPLTSDFLLVNDRFNRASF